MSIFESDVDCLECLDQLEESEKTFDQLARALKALRGYPAAAGQVSVREDMRQGYSGERYRRRPYRAAIRWPVGSSVRVGAGAGVAATVIEVIPTYRVQLTDGGWMVVEERQIKRDTGP